MLRFYEQYNPQATKIQWTERCVFTQKTVIKFVNMANELCTYGGQLTRAMGAVYNNPYRFV